MPGVPSGRGCEACRKQKKKCDQVKPACSRCTRLKLPCIGAGARRYKFKDETVAFRAKDQHSRRALVPSSSGKPLPMVTNETTAMAAAWISTIEVTDVRYSVSYFGHFLRHIPQRLGRNQALDASVGALITIASTSHTGQRTPEMFAQYGESLKALRVTLDDPLKAQRTETLCAIYFVMLCQCWLGLRDDRVVNHGEVLAHIMNAASMRNGRDSFEDGLIFSLSIPVILESMTNPKVRLDPWLLKQAETFGPLRPIAKRETEDNINMFLSTLTISNLAKIPDFIRYPEFHLFDIQLTYEQKRIDVQKLRERLLKLELPPPHEVGSFAPPVGPKTLLYLYYVAYALLLSLALIINGLLRSLDPSNPTLAEESIAFSKDVIDLAERLSKYRPLGAGYIPVCLVAAWAASADLSSHGGIEELIADYQTDFAGARWMDGAIWLKNRFTILRLKTMATQIGKQHDASVAANALEKNAEEKVDLSKSCCIQ